MLLVAGGVPERGQVGGEFLQLGPAGQRRQRFAGGLQCLLGLGEGGESGLPAGLQAAGDQPVLRLAGAEGALGPVGVVAGAFDGKLSGAADPLVPVGDLIGSGERERDLLGGQRVQQHARRPRRRRWRRRTDRQVGRGQPVGAGGALVGGPLVGVVVGAHRLAAATRR